MGIVDSIKETTRKASNSVVDTTEQIVGMQKSPKELANRLIEHLNHQEYGKVAEIITQEAKKHINNMGLDDIAPVNKKLEEFEQGMKDLADKFEEGNYRQIALKLRKVNELLPEDIVKRAPVASKRFKTIKNLIKDIIETLEKYTKGEKKEPDFNKLQEIFEGYFNKLIIK